MKTDITELAQRELYAKVEKQAHSLRGNPFEYMATTGMCPVNVVELHAKKIQALLTDKVGYKEEIAALRQRIAELESRTVKLPHRNLGHPKLFLLCPFPYYDAEDMEKALAAAGIKVEVE